MKTVTCDLPRPFAFSSSGSLSPPLARFYHRMFLWRAEKQRGSLARNSSCGEMGRWQGVQITSACLCLRHFNTDIMFICLVYLRFICFWRNLFPLFTYSLLILLFCCVFPWALAHLAQPRLRLLFCVCSLSLRIAALFDFSMLSFETERRLFKMRNRSWRSRRRRSLKKPGGTPNLCCSGCFLSLCACRSQRIPLLLWAEGSAVWVKNADSDPSPS